MEAVKEELKQRNSSLVSLNEDPKKSNVSKIESSKKIVKDLELTVKFESERSNSQLDRLNKTLLEIKGSIDSKKDCNTLSITLEKIIERQMLEQKNHAEIVSDAIGTIPKGSYPLALTSGVISAFVAALAAFFVTFLYQRYLNNLNRKSHFADISISILDSFQDVASRYWVQDKITGKTLETNNEEEMKVLEIRIKTEFTVLKSSLNEFIGALTDKEQSHKEKITKFINEIYDLSTGGDFESESKKSEITVAAKISKQTANLKSILLKYSQYSS